MPIHGRRISIAAMSDGSTLSAVLLGTANPMRKSSSRLSPLLTLTDELIPMTSPAALSSGPPELP